MPNFPTYEAKRNINATPSSPMISGSDANVESMNKVLSVTQEITQKWSDANDVMEYTERSAKFGIGEALISAEADADPNKDNAHIYKNRIQKLKAEALDGVSNQTVANKMATEFNYKGQIASIKIDAGFNAKKLEYNKVALQQNIDSLLQKKISASENEKSALDLEIKELIDTHIKAGTISYEEAQKLIDGSNKVSVQYDIYSDKSLSEEDSSVLKDLQDPNGKYSNLSPEERLGLIKESQNRIFQNNQSLKKAVDKSQKDRNSSFVSKILDGTVSFKDIDYEESISEESGGMPRKTLLLYKSYLERGVDATLNEMLREKNDSKEPTKRAVLAEKYIDLMDKYMDKDTEYWEAKQLLAEGLKDGRLDKEELKVLEPLKDMLNDIKFNKDTGPINSSIKKIKEWTNSQNKTNEEIASDIKELMLGIGNGENPEELSTQIINRDMMKFFPDINTYPKEGKRKKDPSGRAYIVFPTNPPTWRWLKDGE